MREVAAQKTAALRMSLDAVERQGMPFRGEESGMASGQGMGSVPTRGSSGNDERGADIVRSADHNGGRRRTPGTRSGSDRARVHPPRAAARSALPGPRGRLLRAGRPESPGRHGAAARPGPTRRRRRDAAGLSRRGCRSRPAAMARRAAGRARGPGPGARRRRVAVPRPRRALLRLPSDAAAG